MNAKEARRLSEEAKKTAVERYNAEVEKNYPKIFARALKKIEERTSQGFYDAFIDYTIMNDTLLVHISRPSNSEYILDKIEKELIKLGFHVVYSTYSGGYIVNWENA